MTSGPLTPAPLPPGEGKRASIPTVSLQTARTGASTKANELGMRATQERAYEKGGEQYLVIKPPYAKMTAAPPSPDGKGAGGEGRCGRKPRRGQSKRAAEGGA